MDGEVNRKQIYDAKGKRKAKRRYQSMARRFEREKIILERRYQEELARTMRKLF